MSCITGCFHTTNKCDGSVISVLLFVIIVVIFMELILLLLLFVMFYCFIDKESQNNVFPKKRNDSFTPATQAEFEHVFKYLDGYHQNPEYYEQYWRQDRKENGNGGRRKEDSFIDSDKGNEEHSHVVTSETDNVHPRNPHLMSNSSMGSIDSGIAMHPRGVNLTVGDRGRYHIEEDREDGNSLGLGYIITKGLGPFYPPMSSDRDSENTSG